MKKLSQNINLYQFVVRTIGSSILYAALIIAIVIPHAFYTHETIKLITVLSLSIIVFILVIFNFILPWFIYRLHGYQINELYIVVKKGVLYRRLDYIPIKRIQHIESFQGPIQTLFKIHTLIIYTAGSNDNIIGIPSNKVEPLIHDVRSRLQSYLDSDEGKHDES